MQAFQNTYFPEHISVAAFKPIQGILLIILKLVKSSTKFSLLKSGGEVWCKELSNISISVDIWHPLLFKKLTSLLKPLKWCITLPLLAWSIFWSMAAGGQISTHAQIWSMRSKKMPNAFFTFLNFWTTKNNQDIALDNLCTRNYNIEYLPPHYCTLTWNWNSSWNPAKWNPFSSVKNDLT